jgi:hypothetical protein
MLLTAHYWIDNAEERRVTLEEGAPKLKRHGGVINNDYYDFQSNNFTYCKV